MTNMYVIYLLNSFCTVLFISLMFNFFIKPKRTRTSLGAKTQNPKPKTKHMLS